MAATTSTLFTPRDAHNYRVFASWMTGAVLVFIAATILLDGQRIPDALGWGMTALAVALMLVAMRAYLYFLRHADELLRKVHVEALALSFGIGAIAMMGYRLCERLGAPKLDINDPLLVMVVAWALGQWLGMRRYAGGEE